MEIDAELLDLLVKLAAALLAAFAAWAIKEIKKLLAKKLESEEQADMILDDVEKVLPEEYIPRFRKLRQSWDDEEIPTVDIERLIRSKL